MAFGTIEQAVADLRAGKFIVVADDEDRENEGDLVCAAEHVTPEMVNFMLAAKGMICLALTPERCAQLDLPLMSEDNTEAMRTAFTVSIDAGAALRRDHRDQRADRAPPSAWPPTRRASRATCAARAHPPAARARRRRAAARGAHRGRGRPLPLAGVDAGRA
jgi:3,4-dihydroxy 2-butanone 4-phosphate synthase/GTP cyclohydrolase II